MVVLVVLVMGFLRALGEIITPLSLWSSDQWWRLNSPTSAYLSNSHSSNWHPCQNEKKKSTNVPSACNCMWRGFASWNRARNEWQITFDVSSSRTHHSGKKTRMYKRGLTASCVLSSPIKTAARTLVAAIVPLYLPLLTRHTSGPSCASLWARCNGGQVCANAAGYFVLGDEDTANKATSHMKGSGGSA